MKTPISKDRQRRILRSLRTLQVDGVEILQDGPADSGTAGPGIIRPLAPVPAYLLWLDVTTDKWRQGQVWLTNCLDEPSDHRIDETVVNPERLLRLPGFLNVREKPFVPCKIVEQDPTRTYDFEALMDITGRRTPVGKTFRHETSDSDYAGEEISPADDNMVARAVAYLNKIPPAIQGEGGNNQTFKAACHLRDFGLSAEQTFTLMSGDWNNRCKPPWDVDELRQIINHAYRYAKKKAGNRVRNDVEDFEAYEQAEPPEDSEPEDSEPEDTYAEEAAEGFDPDVEEAEGFDPDSACDSGSAGTTTTGAADTSGSPSDQRKAATSGTANAGSTTDSTADTRGTSDTRAKADGKKYDKPKDVRSVAEILEDPIYDEGFETLTTGFFDIDAVMPLRAEGLYVAGARTGHGKSSLLTNMALRMANAGVPVLVFKLEESDREIVYRLHAAAGRIPLNALLDPAKDLMVTRPHASVQGQPASEAPTGNTGNGGSDKVMNPRTAEETNGMHDATADSIEASTTTRLTPEQVEAMTDEELQAAIWGHEQKVPGPVPDRAAGEPPQPLASDSAEKTQAQDLTPEQMAAMTLEELQAAYWSTRETKVPPPVGTNDQDPATLDPADVTL